MNESTVRRNKKVLDRIVALSIGLLALILYTWTLSRGVFPGPSSEMLLSAVGLEPQLSPMRPLWTLLVNGIGNLSTAGLIWRVHMLHAVFGALTLALLYGCVSWLIFQVIEWDDRTVRRSLHASVLAGLVAALATGVSVPFWIAATRSYYQVFEFLLITIAARLLMRFEESGRKGYVLGFALLYGMGLAETALFWIFAPLFLIALLWVLWRHDRLKLNLLLTMTIAGMVGCSLFFVAASRFHNSEGFFLMGYGGYLQIIRIMLQNHIATVRGSLPRFGFLLLVFLSIVPWLTALIVARRALNDERDWSYYLLHVVMAVIALVVIWNVDFSPWRMFGLGALPVMPYVLNGMVIGYLAAYAWLVAAEWWPDPGYGNFRHAVSRWLGVVMIVPLLGYLGLSAVRNLAEADGRQIGFVTDYADHVLDSLDGRHWLITDGSLDTALRSRAHERGLSLNLLNLAQYRDQVYVKRMQSWFDSPRLKNSAALGVLPLAQDWLQMDPEIEHKVAILGAPDLWAGVDPLHAIPNRTLFLATRTVGDIPSEPLLEAHNDFWDRIEPVLAARTETGLVTTRLYRRHLRRHTGFVANNFGVWLQDRSLHDQAFDVYLRARAIDPNNVSAMLNLMIMMQAGHRPELHSELEAEAEGFFEGITHQPNIWSLSRYYGYVREPMAFARLGQSWALSGQPGIAVSGLKRAMELLPTESRDQARQPLADMYLLRDDDERGEALYWELLVENPENESALLTLARIATRRGDFEQARSLLERAEAARVTPATLAMEWASFYLASGQDGRARLALEELVEIEPGNLRAWAMLSAVLVQQNEIDRLEVVVREMERLAGQEDFLVLVGKAQLAIRQRNWSEARNYFRRAVRQRPNVPLVQEWVLRMDFMLADKESGEQTARSVLRLDRENAYANYIIGSLLLERGQLEAAEDHLRTSVSARRLPEALSDLAVLLQQMGQYEEAESRAREAFQLDNQMYFAWDTLGVIYMQKGQLEDAENAFETALSMTQDDMRVYLHMAMLQEKKGNRDQARELIAMLESRRADLPRREQQMLSELAQKLVQR